MTLLYCSPRFLDHETGDDPERAERIAQIPQRLKEAGLSAKCTTPDYAPVSRQRLARVHTAAYIDEIWALGEVGRGAHRGGHHRQPGQLRRGPDGRRLRVRRRRTAGPRRRHAGPVPGPPARPSRHGQPGDGLLPVQQRGRGRPAGHRRARARPRADRRLGHPSRQRHAGHVLGRPAGRLPLDPPLAVLSRHAATPTRPAAAAAWAPRSTCRSASARRGRTISPSSAATWRSSPPRSSRNWC